MARERAIQIRVSHEEYGQIKDNAGDKPIGQFLRELGLSAGGSEIRRLAKQRHPHLPLAFAERKVREESR